MTGLGYDGYHVFLFWMKASALFFFFFLVPESIVLCSPLVLSIIFIHLFNAYWSVLSLIIMGGGGSRWV